MDSSTTFDECVERNGLDCQANLLWLQIPFLCGQSADCWFVYYIIFVKYIVNITNSLIYYLLVIICIFHRIPGSEWALGQAKRNVLEKYILVGVTEQMTEFLQMLELIIPGGMFRNASEHFKHSMYMTLINYYYYHINLI